jgi:hypothetical protein
LLAGVEEQERAMEADQRLGIADDRLDPPAASTGQELDEVEAPERGGVLILRTDRLAEDLDLDLGRLRRECRRRFVRCATS